MILQVGLYPHVFYFLAPCLRHTAKLLLALNAAESASAEVGGNARGATAAEGVEHPVALVRRGKDDAGQEGERLLRRVLATRLLPPAYGRQSPHVGHLFALVQPFHHVVVKLVRHLLRLPRPYHKLR